MVSQCQFPPVSAKIIIPSVSHPSPYLFLSVIDSLIYAHTRTHTHTCIHISTARCLVLRVLLPVTKSLVSDITHKSLLINSSPGTKLAFGHGRCSRSFFTAGQVRRLLMAASLPFLFCSLSLSFCFFTLVFSLSHTSHTTSLHHIYPACSAMFCRHQSFSQRQSSEQA